MWWLTRLLKKHETHLDTLVRVSKKEKEVDNLQKVNINSAIGQHLINNAL